MSSKFELNNKIDTGLCQAVGILELCMNSIGSNKGHAGDDVEYSLWAVSTILKNTQEAFDELLQIRRKEREPVVFIDDDPIYDLFQASDTTYSGLDSGGITIDFGGLSEEEVKPVKKAGPKKSAGKSAGRAVVGKGKK